jgi:uncharacterized protein (TIGR00730 family)
MNPSQTETLLTPQTKPGSGRRICVFCGSTDGNSPLYAAAARSLGQRLAASGMGLVYGGAAVGLMGLLADAVLEGGGEVTGVLPGVLKDREIAHPGLTRLHFVGSMHERKALMASLADAFVALPGGYGTLDEFLEILTWAQLKIHAKPCILINTTGYYDGLLAFLDHAVREGFLKAENRSLVRVASDVPEAMSLIAQFATPQRAHSQNSELA